MKRKKTFTIDTEKIERKWYLMDARGKTLGRIATIAAGLLRGKGKPTFSPHIDGGDHLIIINAKEVVVTGAKEEDKFYFTHSGYPGGHKMKSVESTRAAHPERLLYHAIRGMLPVNKLADKIITKLRIFPGEGHSHEAQKPERIEV
jgi:large subunit ribosomal protein L13